jgi:hypothetical protein
VLGSDAVGTTMHTQGIVCANHDEYTDRMDLERRAFVKLACDVRPFRAQFTPHSTHC